jgi:CheY-like chemotaxis protein
MVAPSGSTDLSAPTVRVAVVDDAPDVRHLVRILFELDRRFELVGEAADGAAAVDLVTALQPDLLLLDRQMPVLTGVQALPQIRRAAPRTAVILYTAQVEDSASEAALAAGALEVLGKDSLGPRFVDQLVDVLLRHWGGPDALLEVALGPVPSSAARLWLDNTERILAAVRANPAVLDITVPDPVFDALTSFLVTWRAIATADEEFYWRARALPADVIVLLEAWAAIDRLPDESLHALGCDWSGPPGRVFFEALSGAILAALEGHEATSRLATTLASQWR